ncbi:MAG TPA: RDD family protein [Acidimicrobiales bacterium]
MADWGTRAKGLLIDAGIELVVAVPLYVIGLAAHFVLALAYLALLALSVYLAIQVGQTGQSPGMRVAGIKCVSQRSGEVIGGGLGVVRAIAHFLDSLICYIGWLFPLWDANRQTLSDKVMGTVVIPVPPQRFTLAPPQQR